MLFFPGYLRPIKVSFTTAAQEMYAEQIHEQLQNMGGFLEYEEHRVSAKAAWKWVMMSSCSSVCVVLQTASLL